MSPCVYPEAHVQETSLAELNEHEVKGALAMLKSVAFGTKVRALSLTASNGLRSRENMVIEGVIIDCRSAAVSDVIKLPCTKIVLKR